MKQNMANQQAVIEIKLQIFYTSVLEDWFLDYLLIQVKSFLVR
jgi:hypothetical protein